MTRHRDLSYEAIRNPHLSWGYWIVLDAVGHPTWPLVDEQGERWGSLRHALWHGRLSMGGLTHALVPEEDEQCEVLLFVLAAISRTIVSTSESVHDLFAGDWRQTGHYAQWLTGHGLITPCHTLAGAKLTCEGTAILRMLAETRGRGRAGVPVAIASLHPFGALRTDPDQAAIESQIAELEAALPEPLPCRFARRVIAGSACIVLVGPADARLLRNETLWSLSLLSAIERDQLYIWLLRRADRWEAWLSIVQQRAARAFTEHLLALFTAQLSDA